MLALRKVASDHWSRNLADISCIPWGAGLCVKRNVATDYIKLLDELGVFAAVGRQGQNLFCGEDDLFSWSAVVGGYDFGVFPSLRVQHLISRHRLSQNYILRLVRDHSFSHTILKYVRGSRSYQSVNPFQMVRLCLHGMKNGVFSMRCRWAEIKGCENARQFISQNSIEPIGTREQSFCRVLTTTGEE